VADDRDASRSPSARSGALTFLCVGMGTFLIAAVAWSDDSRGLAVFMAIIGLGCVWLTALGMRTARADDRAQHDARRGRTDE
jgi:hypothetical protein